MTKYEKAKKFLQITLNSAAQSSDDYGVNQSGYYEIGTAIEALEKQIPKKPYLDNDNGEYEKEYCPTCDSRLFPNEHHCKCGQALDWSDSE